MNCLTPPLDGLAQRLWWRCNEVVQGGVWSSPQSLVRASTQALEDFQMAKEVREPSLMVGMRHISDRWTAPPLGWMKANWDAAIDHNQGMMGGAVVIRDHWGNLIVARSWCRKGRFDPLAVEAYAAGMALKTCRVMSYEKVQFEGDAKVVMDAVNSGEIDRGRIGHVVEDLRAEMTWSINWKMSYV